MAKTEKRRTFERFPKQLDAAIRAAEDKKAADLVVLDLRKATGFTDYFLICSGSNPRQIRAIADAIMDALAVDGAARPHLEATIDRNGFCSTTSISSYIFAPDTRLFYDLERLWATPSASTLTSAPAGEDSVSTRPRHHERTLHRAQPRDARSGRAGAAVRPDGLERPHCRRNRHGQNANARELHERGPGRNFPL
jgi:ribosome-associated protein